MNQDAKSDLFETMDVRRAVVRRAWWRRRSTWIVIGIVALLGLGVWAWQLSDGSVADVARSEVWLGTVKQGNFVVQVQAAGKLVPAHSRWIAVPSGGVVEQVQVAPGQRVAKGAPLVMFSNPQVLNAAQSAAANLAAAEARYLARKQQQENAVLSQRSRIEGLKVDVLSAAMHLQADKTLAERGIVPMFKYRNEKLKYGLLQKQLRFGQERLANLESGNRSLLQAEAEQVRQQRALLTLRKAEAAQLTVRAPMAGVVEQVSAEPGQQLAAGANIARISTPNQLIARVQVSQYDAASVRVGQAVLIDPRGAAIAGRVLRINPTVRGGLVTVYIAPIGKLSASARVDQSVTATIRVARLQNVRFVARPANVQANSSAAVFELAAGSAVARRRQVRFGVASSNRIQVLSGLKPGERVVLSDVSAYSHYQQLRLR